MNVMSDEMLCDFCPDWGVSGDGYERGARRIKIRLYGEIFKKMEGEEGLLPYRN